jgi:hypothetical protein
VAALVGTTGTAQARLAAPLVLSDGRFHLDLGLGLAHDGRGDDDRTGVGVNMELSWGLGGGFELGLRTGLRSDEGRANDGLSADAAGRMFDPETYGMGFGALANPEVRLRRGLSGGLFSLALEGRAFIPFDDHFGFMVALPVQIGGGGPVRIDTGIFVPIVFRDDTFLAFSLPLHLWFRAGDTKLGPVTGARFSSPGDDWAVPLGFAMDRPLGSQVDLLGWFLFPDVTQDSAAQSFAGGVGIRVVF